MLRITTVLIECLDHKSSMENINTLNTQKMKVSTCQPGCLFAMKKPKILIDFPSFQSTKLILIS